MWDGAGSEISVADDVAAMTLNLADISKAREESSPAPVDLSVDSGWARVAAVTLPAAMEMAAALP